MKHTQKNLRWETADDGKNILLNNGRTIAAILEAAQYWRWNELGIRLENIYRQGYIDGKK